MTRACHLQSPVHARSKASPRLTVPQSKPCKSPVLCSAVWSNCHRIRKNATTSPLLLLASEVRENILRHLLGDELIHVKYLDVFRLSCLSDPEDEHLAAGSGEDGRTDEPPSSTDLDAIHPTMDPSLHHHNDSDDSNSHAIGAHQDRLTSPTADPVSLSVSHGILRPTFRHAICVAAQSEQSAYKDAISGTALVPEGESPDFYVAPCEKRHATCKMCGKGPMVLREEDRQALRVDLNVLGVCRQLYEEANHLLWTTNTFSFDDPKTFNMFFGSLNPAQKRNLTSIHISTEIGGCGGWYSSTYQRTRWDSSYWGSALKMSNLNMLRGVRTLHLCFDQRLESHASGDDFEEEEIENAQQADMEFLLRLRALAVKHVTVIVSDDAEKLESRGRSSLRWTAIKKNRYAESIRSQLVDPKGADFVKTELEAAKLAKKIEHKDKTAARVTAYRSLLKAKKAHVAHASELAIREEARAVSASQEANQGLRQHSKKAVKLRHMSEKRKQKAEDARNAADVAFKRQVFLQKQLADAMEQHKRAMVKLGATPREIEDEEDVDRLLEGLSRSDMGIENSGAPGHGFHDSEEDESPVSRPEGETSDGDDEISS